MNKKCPRCGAEVDESAMFCDECGAALAQQGTEQISTRSTNNYSTSAVPASAMKHSGLGIASMVCGIIAICTFGAFFIPEIVGLILGIIAMGDKTKKHTFDIVGIVTSVMAFILVIAILMMP